MELRSESDIMRVEHTLAATKPSARIRRTLFQPLRLMFLAAKLRSVLDLLWGKTTTSTLAPKAEMPVSGWSIRQRRIATTIKASAVAFAIPVEASVMAMHLRCRRYGGQRG
jgi:hypothetical protein